MKLQVSENLLKEIHAHTGRDYPDECCGLLIGRFDGSIFTVTRIVDSPNISATKLTNFEIDPGVRIKLERELRGQDEMIIGHYHSHPNGLAQPSPRDMEAAFEPDLIWLIIAVGAGGVQEARAWQCRAGQALPVSLAIS